MLPQITNEKWDGLILCRLCYFVGKSGEKNPDLAVEDDDSVVKVVVLQGGLCAVERGQGRAAPTVRIDKGPAIKGQVIILVTG